MWRFNGLVLLTGYLQRFYVHERVRQMLGDGGPETRLKDLAGMIDVVTELVRQTEADRRVPANAAEAVRPIILRLREWVADYQPQPRAEVSTAEMVATVAGVIYAEGHVNRGIIQMGELFDSELADRYRQLAPAHQSNAAAVNTAVAQVARQEPIEESLRLQMETWYEQARASREKVISDIEAVAVMLEGESPAT